MGVVGCPVSLFSLEVSAGGTLVASSGATPVAAACTLVAAAASRTSAGARGGAFVVPVPLIFRPGTTRNLVAAVVAAAAAAAAAAARAWCWSGRGFIPSTTARLFRHLGCEVA